MTSGYPDKAVAAALLGSKSTAAVGTSLGSAFPPVVEHLRELRPEVRALDGYWLATYVPDAPPAEVSAFEPHSIVDTAKAVAVFLHKFASLTDVSIFSKGVRRHVGLLANFVEWIQRFHPDGSVPGISSTHENSLVLQQSANALTGIFDKQEVVSLQTVDMENICLEGGNVKIKTNVKLTSSAASLDPSIFAASLILHYYKQLMEQVEHVDMYKTVDALTAFGEQLNLLREEDGQPAENIEQSWRDIALLTGWELIRRCKEDGLKESHLKNTRDVIDSSLRILRHRDVHTVQHFASVAFALGERQ